MDADASSPDQSLVTRGWLLLNAAVAAAFTLVLLVGEATGTVWLQGVGGTGALVFWLGVVGGLLWRRYHRWRYPTVYERERQ